MSRKRHRGEGSVFYSESRDRWVGRARVGATAKAFYGPKGDRSRVARLSVEERLRPYLNVSHAAAVTLTLESAVDAYLRTHSDLAVSTRAGYETSAAYIKDDPISVRRLLEIEPVHVRAFYERLKPGRPERGETGATMKLKVHVLLHAVLEEAVRMDLIPRNPAARVPRPKVVKREVPVWTPEEMRRFLAAIRGHRLYPLFLLAICSTMGNAELFGLRWSDIDLERAQLTVRHNLVTVSGKAVSKEPKTIRRRRTIALPSIVVQALREHRKTALAKGAASTYVFTNRKGEPLRGDSFRSKVWDPLVLKAKVRRITPYGLRHCAKALMEHLGVSLEVASRRMGHSTIKTTADVYGHLYDEAGRVVAAKLDEFFRDLA